MYEQRLFQEKLNWPIKTIKRLEDELDKYKNLWLNLTPKIEKSIQEVDQYYLVNDQLMRITDRYSNFKLKAQKKYVEMC